MRTTLDLPQDLLEEALKTLGFKSKTDAVIYSLQEMLRRRKIEELKGLAGKVRIVQNLKKSRRRG
jgi:Arc/MetJ family transcription regulator